jgi:hypothetical protein
VVESVALAQPFEFTVDFAEVSGDTLVQAFLGTKSAFTQAAGTLDNHPIVAKLGAWVPVGKMGLATAGLVVTNSTGATTYVLGTDYEVNYRMGWIKPLVGGAITADQALLVDAAYGALTGTQIAGGTQAQIRARFMLDGKNQVDNLPVIVEVHEAVIAADSAFDFLGDDFNAVSLPGKLKTPVGKSEPFTVKLLNAAI